VAREQQMLRPRAQDACAAAATCRRARALILPACFPMPPTPVNLILIAEDDADDLFLLRRRLEKLRVRQPVVTFTNGADLVTFLRASAGAANNPLRAALLFLDLNMPKLDGFEALSWIRQQPLLADLNVVVLSGGAEPSDLARAKALGVKHSLMKFPDLTVLAEIIGELPPG
jgi:two-component system, response regulator